MPYLTTHARTQACAQIHIGACFQKLAPLHKRIPIGAQTHTCGREYRNGPTCIENEMTWLVVSSLSVIQGRGRSRMCSNRDKTRPHLLLLRLFPLGEHVQTHTRWNDAESRGAGF